MKKSLVLIVLSATFLFLGYADLHAQHLRPDRTAFVRPYTGMVGFMGDDNRSLVSFDDAIPYSFGLELGYQLSRPFSLSAGYLLNNDVRMIRNAETNLRHTAQVMSRYTYGRQRGLAPYVHAGAFVSSGQVYPDGGAKERRSAYGPLLGIGLDLPVSSRVSLFLETNTRAAFPDAAMDGLDDGGFGNFDLHSSLGAGLKINFRPAMTPIAVFSVHGPEELQVGEEGLFTARTNEDRATRPVKTSWDFGDGGKVSGTTARHRFQRAGTYRARFTASNRAGTVSDDVVVRVVPVPAAPNISGLKADPADPDTETAVRFTADVRGDAPLTYRWDLGDGTISTEARPAHTFAEAGTYGVTLRVENGVGHEERSIRVKVRRYEAEMCSEIVDMNPAFFDRNESGLSSDARRVLTDNAEILLECANTNVRIEGFAAPGERYPQQLSESRARAVEAFYAEHGVARSRMRVQGRGVVDATTSKKDGTSRFQRVDSVPLR